MSCATQTATFKRFSFHVLFAIALYACVGGLDLVFRFLGGFSSFDLHRLRFGGILLGGGCLFGSLVLGLGFSVLGLGCLGLLALSLCSVSLLDFFGRGLLGGGFGGFLFGGGSLFRWFLGDAIGLGSALLIRRTV